MQQQQKIKHIPKPLLKLVILGPPDSGKSTATGFLFHKLHQFGQPSINKNKDKGLQQDQLCLNNAQLINRFKSDQERGIKSNEVQQTFETNRYQFTLIDIPGHRDFVKNLITGVSEVYCAILYLSAIQEEQEMDALNQNLIKEQIFLAHSLGIQQIVVCINKMDEINWQQCYFNEKQDNAQKYFQQICPGGNNTQFIPISGKFGDNIIEKSINTQWYKGPTLIEALDTISLPQRLADKPLRLPLQNVYKIGGIGTVALGIVGSGQLKTGMPIVFVPPYITTYVNSLEIPYQLQELGGQPGDEFGFNIKNVLVKDLKRGYVCSDPLNDPAREAASFLAYIFVLKWKIEKDCIQSIYCHTCKISCKCVEIISKHHRRNGKLLQTQPQYVEAGEAAIVRIVPTKPMCVESFSDYPQLGRFVLKLMKFTIAAGVIISVQKLEPKIKID